MNNRILTPEEQKRLQEVQLIALLEIDRICKKHNIRYFLAFGTLLGAVRHKGFIPWDDDVDITIPRDDLYRFISVCSSELNPEFFLQTSETDPNYYLPITRIRVNDTTCVETMFSGVDMHNGIFVDIYPCDNIPDKKWQQIIYRYLAKYLITAVAVLARPDIKQQSIPKIIGAVTLPLPLRCIPKSTRIKLRDNYLAKYNSKQTRDVVVQDGMGLVDKYIYPHAFIDNVEFKDFEGFSLPCSPLSHNMLSQMYGDYMKLPPIEKRCQHHGFLELDFGRYCSEEVVNTMLNRYRGDRERLRQSKNNFI